MALNDDALIAPDYLGVPSEVSTKGTASLPIDQPFQPSAAPATAGGSGAAPRSSANTLGTFSLGPSTPTTLGGAQGPQSGVVTAGIDPASRTIPIPPNVQQAVTALPPEARESVLQRLASMGGKAAQLGNELAKLFGKDTPNSTLGTALGGAAGAASAPLTDADIMKGFNLETRPDAMTGEAATFEIDPSGAEIAARPAGAALDLAVDATGLSAADRLVGAAAEFGDVGASALSLGDVASGAGALFRELSILNSKGPADKKIFDTVGNIGGLAASVAGGPLGGLAAGLVHQYVSTPIIEAIFGEFGDSKAWRNFPNELGQTLQLTETSNQQLAAKIANAQNPDEISAAIAEWKSSLGSRVGGFGAGSGAFDIPDVPGATGTKHEGGITVNFNPQTAGLRAMSEVARRGGTLAERIQAFRDAAVGAMSNTERISADPSGSLLTPEMQSGWKSSLMEQTQQSHPEIAKALASGELTAVQAQGVLDALSPGTTSFVVPPSPDILAKFTPPTGALSPDQQAAQDFALAGFSAGGE